MAISFLLCPIRLKLGEVAVDNQNNIILDCYTGNNCLL